ncbi:hypothetical protein EDC04DRAFT_2825254 [Pisolithus marmoratus]|nr:hypothetical protein EDC04DRAFT_2825254 [Pisolithus marmoratus]
MLCLIPAEYPFYTLHVNDMPESCQWFWYVDIGVCLLLYLSSHCFALQNEVGTLARAIACCIYYPLMLLSYFFLYVPFKFLAFKI